MLATNKTTVFNEPIVFQTPTLNEITQRIQNSVLAELPESNPFLDSSVLKALITALAGANHEVYIQVQQVMNQVSLWSSKGEFVDKLAYLKEITRLAGSQSIGKVNFEGVDGTIIPLGTLLQSNTGNTYTVDDDATVATTTETNVSGNVSGITVSLFYLNHGLATGNNITVTGGSESTINGNHAITVIDKDNFSYDTDEVAIPGAISNLIVVSTIATVDVTSVESGSDQNLGQGPQIALQTQITGIEKNGQGYIPVDEIKGGTDEETDPQLKNRVVDKIQNPPAAFNQSDIRQNIALLNLPFQVTVISPFDIGGVPSTDPAPGTVIVIFVVVEDDGTTIRDPTGAEITLVKQKLNNDTGPAPANLQDPSLGDNNVFVKPPKELVSVNIVINGLIPGDLELQDSITNNLKVYFADTVPVSQADPLLISTTKLTMNQITAVIGNSVNEDSGEIPLAFAFTLNGGTASLTIAAQKRPVLNSVTYA